MQTHPTIDVDLSLEAEDVQEEPCAECSYDPAMPDSVATWYVVTKESCPCLPNPMPLCEFHTELAQAYLNIYGPLDWRCHLCDHMTDVVDVKRIRG